MSGNAPHSISEMLKALKQELNNLFVKRALQMHEEEPKREARMKQLQNQIKELETLIHTS